MSLKREKDMGCIDREKKEQFSEEIMQVTRQTWLIGGGKLFFSL
jgi:hypothetical protein